LPNLLEIFTKELKYTQWLFAMANANIAVMIVNNISLGTDIVEAERIDTWI
jgi:hypothetical protein